MSGFKLLAIRPLKDCYTKFRKNLREGEIYKFYQDYRFLDKNNNEILNNLENQNSNVAKVEIPKDELDLYSQPNSELTINISAIVGKNGSGKSTLIELLFVAAYILALDKKILERNDDEAEVVSNRINELKDNLFKHQVKIQDEVTLKRTKKKISQIERNEDHLDFLKKLGKEITALRKLLRLEVFYQIGENILCLKLSNKKSEIIPINYSYEGDKKSNKSVVKEFTNHFFYSLVLNYSQYALNSREIGVWIQELFHKNDAYQTPIVINPMRTEGNFNINTENDLVHQRLLANILTPLKQNQTLKDSMRQLAQGHIAYRMKLELNENKFKNDLGRIEFLHKEKHKEDWKSIEKEFNLNTSNRGEPDYDNYAKTYIIKKLKSMSEKYSLYNEYYDGTNFLNIKAYLKALKDDDSHIAYKFHQAINFLKYGYAFTFIKAIKDALSIDELAKVIKNPSKDKQIIHFVPPSFFKVEVYFDEYKKEEKETNTLQNLSSGEKQHVYAVSSIMYHLRYLDSVELKKDIEHKYKHINLVFDEIELYYHPESQRSFIKDLLKAVKRCNLNNGIESINCIFITHSPFILSDIPYQNILRLENGKPSSKKFDQTFGANIHQLLQNDFFLDNGFIGEFAKESINETISYFTYHINEREINELESRFTESKKDKVPKYLNMKKSVLKEENEHISTKLKIDISPERKEYHKNFIELIGENIIRLKLNEMVELAFPYNND